MESELILIILNMAVTSVGGYITLCRLAVMSHSTTKLAIRWQYVIWFCALFASGWSFILFDPPDFIQMMMGSAIVAHLFLGAPAWHRAPPLYARRDGDDLWVNGVAVGMDDRFQRRR